MFEPASIAATKTVAQPTMYPAFGKQVSNWSYFKKNRHKRTAANIMHFNLQFEAVDVAVAQAAFQQMVNRHESLRAVFRETPEGLVQVIMPYQQSLHGLQHVRCFNKPHFERKRKALSLQIDNSLRDLEKGPLFKGVIYEVGRIGYMVEISINHIISDAWTVQLMRNELLQFYQSVSQRRPPALRPVQLKAYINSYHSAAVNERKRKFWCQRLKELPAVNWPVLLDGYNNKINNEKQRRAYVPRFLWSAENIERALNHTHGYTYATFLNAANAAKVKEISVKYTTTPSIVIMASFLMLVRWLFKTHHTLIISRLNGRFHAESHDIIGNLTCAVYSHINDRNLEQAGALINAMHDDLLDSLDYAIYNPLLVSDIPLTTHCHLCANIITDEENEGENHCNKLIQTPIKTYFPLEVVVLLKKEGIVFNWIYNTCLFRNSVVRYIVQAHTAMLEKICNPPNSQP
jgi:hypothetical protein